MLISETKGYFSSASKILKKKTETQKEALKHKSGLCDDFFCVVRERYKLEKFPLQSYRKSWLYSDLFFISAADWGNESCFHRNPIFNSRNESFISF